MKIEQFEKHREPILETFKKDGFNGICEYSTYSSVPLIYSYQFILDNTNDIEIKKTCSSKISRLREFYGDLF